MPNRRNSSEKINYGWGKQLRYAGNQAIVYTAKNGGGRFAWEAKMKMCWSFFSKFSKQEGVKDARFITIKLVKKYRNSITSDNPNTIQNYLSAINSVMSILSHGQWVKFSPVKLAGVRRSRVRKRPIIFSDAEVQAVCSELGKKGLDRQGAAVLLGYYFGLRRREACLLECALALKQARKFGVIEISRGTKGGVGRSSSIDRLVPVNQFGIQILERVTTVIGKDRCLVPSRKMLKSLYNDISNRVLTVLKKHRIDKFHELRTAYACARYEQITGHPAPCNLENMSSKVDFESDQCARKIVSKELGHSRVSILNSYIGCFPGITRK